MGIGRQPTYEEYAQIMTEQVPVLSGIAKGFGVFDHRTGQSGVPHAWEREVHL